MFAKFDLDDAKLKISVKELSKCITKQKEDVMSLLDIKDKTYGNFFEKYQILSENLNTLVTPIFHINSVNNSALSQEVSKDFIEILTKYDSWLSQNKDIYDCLLQIQTKYKSDLNEVQNKVLDDELRDFKLSGCFLNDDKKEELEKINLKLGLLSKEFSQNILDDIDKYELIVENFEDIKELPQSDLNSAKIQKDGKTVYKFTLNAPSFIAFMTYATNRELREQLYKASVTKAPQNGQILEDILALKKTKAGILGFENYASLSLSTKMASSEDEVLDFLTKLAVLSKPKAFEELDEIRKIANKDDISDIYSYDLAYYSQKLKKEKYDIDEEFYKNYFEINHTIEKMFEFYNTIFNIEFRYVAQKSWHEKVRIYDIYENEKVISRIYLDLEARKNKQNGAWMNNWHSHYNLQGKKQLATAFVVCNFQESTKTNPSLLKHDDIVTLFHEMGHALHHLLSTVNDIFVSGVNGVAWDVVEFPSQFLEYFSYNKDVLKLLSSHIDTKENLQDKDIEKLIKARNFQSSLNTIRQVEFGLFDFKIHQKLYNKDEVQNILDDIRDNLSPLKPPSYNKFQNGFSHIFAGGYSAGYYSYKWAEVLSADAYMIYNDCTDEKNKTQFINDYKKYILNKGGSQNMNTLYFNFAKQKPNVESLLKMDGIL